MDTKKSLQRYSSVLAIVCSAIVVVIGGWLTHWAWGAIFYIFAGLALMWLFAHLFYGFAAARAEEAQQSDVMPAAPDGSDDFLAHAPGSIDYFEPDSLTPDRLAREAAEVDEAEKKTHAKDTSA